MNTGTSIASPLATALQRATRSQLTRLTEITGLRPDRLLKLADRSGGGQHLAPWLKREIAAALRVPAADLFDRGGQRQPVGDERDPRHRAHFESAGQTRNPDAAEGRNRATATSA